jgi:hypothetical protein
MAKHSHKMNRSAVFRDRKKDQKLGRKAKYKARQTQAGFFMGELGHAIVLEKINTKNMTGNIRIENAILCYDESIVIHK